jgi:hypothetical protein
MEKATLSTLFGLILLSLLVPGPAFAQAPASAVSPQEQSEKELNRDLDAGKGCLDYKLDIVSLVDNDHRMFWKQGDCIRVHVANNPFLFKYTLEFNEQVIKEDDPLSAFGGKFGLNVSNVSSASPGGTPHTTQADKENNTAALQKSVNDAAKEAYSEIAAQPVNSDAKGFLSLQVENLSKDLATPQTSTSAEKKLEHYEQQVDKANIDQSQKKQAKQSLQEVANAAKPVNPPPAADVAALTDSANRVQHIMALIVDEYRKFSRDVQGRLSVLVLRDPPTPLDKVSRVATKLRDDSNNELSCLTDAQFDADYTKLLGCPQNVNSDPSDGSVDQLTVPSGDCTSPTTHSFICQLLMFARKAQPLHTAIEKALPNDNANDLLDQLHAAAQDVAYEACVYEAFSDSDLNSIRTGLIAPLNSVLSDGFAFGYQFPRVSKKREGPFVDPTSVTMTLTRDPVSPFTTDTGASKILEYTTSSYTCSGDPEDLLTNGSSYKSLADFFTDKPAKVATALSDTANTRNQTTANLYMRNQNKPALRGQTTSTTAGDGPAPSGGNAGKATKPSTSDAPSTAVQPWLFGKPRLVLSGGMSMAFLTKQEFQRSMSINNGTTQTVVGFKTNTKLRTTPMLYGHAFIPWFDRRHDSDAWYATFGVTANSDNKGTSPEFLFGLSRSFVQQRFFVTAGAYLGERQKLDGGLHIGDVIPSTFTGELPVTKSYHASFAFGISYRFASTKIAQDNTKQTTGGSNKKGN